MIRVGFSTRPGNPFSWVIRKVTGAPYSHVWMLVEDPFFGVDVVYEAGERGFMPTSWAKFQKANDVVDIRTPKHQLAMHQGFRKAVDLLGEPYDVGGLLGMAWVVAARRWWGLKASAKNPLHEAGMLFCVSVVVEVMRRGFYPGASALGESTSDPLTLHRFLAAE